MNWRVSEIVRLITVNLTFIQNDKVLGMKTVTKTTLFVLSVLLLVSCGGGGGSSGGTAGNSAKSYSLSASSIPIASTDNLVSVTVSGTQFSSADASQKSFFARLFDLVIPNALAAINPTVSVQASAKVVNGAVTRVDPVFKTTVPDKTQCPTVNGTVTCPTPMPTKQVSVRCDVLSLPTVVNVYQAWLLDASNNDILVSMSYPDSVTANYDESTESFSSCNFVYKNGYFVIFGDGSVSGKLDDKLGASDSGACANISPIVSVIPRGDSSKNVSGFPIIQNLLNTGVVDNGVYQTNSGVCGSVRLLDYSSTGGSFTTLNFGAQLAVKGSSTIAADTNYVYSLSWKVGYPNQSAANDSCPVIRVKITDNTSTCVTTPNISNFFAYPVAANQVSNTNKFTSSDASFFLDTDGKFSVSFLPFNLGCGVGSCGNVGAFQPPTLFKVTGTNATATLITTNTQNYPSGYQPAGSLNGYLLLSGNGGGPFNGVLWKYSNGNILRTCLYDATFGDSCKTQKFGNLNYGISYCSYNTGHPHDCLGTPSIGRVNTATGVVTNWDPVALGWLPVQGDAASVNGGGTSLAYQTLFLPDQIIFKACPAPTNMCVTPVYVSLNYATGQITPADSSLTDDILTTLVTVN
jgi:hypothetical protein